MVKRKGLFVIFFSILLFINSYLYFLISDRFIQPNTYSTIITVLLLFIVIIPLTAYLSEKLVLYSFHKGLDNSRNFKIFIALLIIVPITLIFAFIVNDNREKSLDDIISYHSSSFDSFEFRFDGDSGWKTDEKEPLEELTEFLGKYQIKKMKDDEWDRNVTKEKSFTFTIFTKGKIIIGSLYENRLVLYNRGNYYKVINGPIDMDWVQNFNEKYQ